ncbi:tol-pal system protein YbgF [Biformimicrobium ophioploci]|uniref:Cell division coordinator CpoB n=1 Tax=Biformimicrobium ophioploci TaxID=3036711 RepID=A0ABQ6LYW5_9GAMM|nr:tol-pal system protein YbgF [Microbulbifer sp. NKW57]GMG87256.1 tol-pal system protein YbgF [Microbulbifer sp. NKW57]
MVIRTTLAAAFMAAVSQVSAQAPIVEISGDAAQSRVAVARVTPRQSDPQPQPQAAANGEAYYQMQVLQQEVLQLRGMVEELAHEVKRLKQQRLDDYMDLDRRIARLSGEAPRSAPDGAAAPAAGGSASVQPVTPPAQVRPQPQQPAANAGDERERYQASFKLARSGDYLQATDSFKQFLQDFPSGQFAPNANYWLGEIALVEGDLEEARKWFAVLVDEFPSSSKAWDGRYKLGTVYHQLGDKDKARQYLQAVADANVRASLLAKKYLQDNL